MENQIIKISLTESNFTHISKVGSLTYQNKQFGNSIINFHKTDIINLAKGQIVIKEIGVDSFQFILQFNDLETIKEIIKRSPIYYELSSEL